METTDIQRGIPQLKMREDKGQESECAAARHALGLALEKMNVAYGEDYKGLEDAIIEAVIVEFGGKKEEIGGEM